MKTFVQNKITMYLDKISLYSNYADCLSRILNDYIQNGDDNIKPTDISNLAELLTKLSSRLNYNVNCLKQEWEFND